MAAPRSSGSLLRAAFVTIVAAWMCLTLDLAFVIGAAPDTRPISAPTQGLVHSSAAWGSSYQKVEEVPGLTARAAKKLLSDEWEETCKEFCELKCAKPSKKAACKAHCEIRDLTRPLYDKC
mmetsp:Transcript_18763/g.51702  ORF Transcript_18763/g.51702 Transcript_18763/m.51702 type:complete len:121 (-) Transcript_18763:115-477(-)